MCGIAGCIALNGNINSNTLKQRIAKMASSLIHRGPDDGGIYIKEHVALGHRRLSILDLSELGHQPMQSDGYVIVFNGEIYNFKELRKELQDLGYHFNSESDTEVILKGFIAWNTKLFKKLNGIFSFAIFNENNGELFLVRDRLGVKPLYIYNDHNELVFASEIKAIRETISSVIDKISYKALSEFLYYGNSLGKHTLFNNVYAVEPGSYMHVKNDKVSVNKYWQPEKLIEQTATTSDQAISKVSIYLEEAVRRQLISDVPVGVFLSGGIDSSAITAFATKHYNGKLKTFAAAFDFDKGVNEFEKAKYVSNYYGTEHTELFIRGADLPSIVEKMVYHHDEPFSDAANIPLFLMAQQVKPYATVVLQGDGGDELFGGYNRYFMLQKFGYGYQRTLMKMLSAVVGKINSESNKVSRALRMINAFGQKQDAMTMALLLTTDTLQNNTKQVLSEKLLSELAKYDSFEHYKNTYDRFRDKSLLQQMLYVDSQIILPNTFLEKVDKSTMAASIEVRVPFLDYDLVDYVMSLPAEIKLQNGEKKYLLKQSLRGIVPDKILDGPKTGFGVPYENWLRGPLYDFMNDKLNSSYIKGLGIFDYKILDKRIRDHKNAKGNYGFQLWKLMNLSIWLEKNKISL